MMSRIPTDADVSIRPGSEDPRMTGHDPDAGLSIPDLLSTATSLFERLHGPLLPGVQGPQGLSVRYLRRKPGRGLAVIYDVYALPAGSRPRVAPRARAGHHTRSMSLTLDEHALDGTRIRLSARQVHQAAVEVQPAGVVGARDLGLCVQAFPADGGLPALAASCTPTAQGPLWQALQSAACAQLGDDGWRLVAARAEPVRYKPASRCVLRYQLTLEHPHLKGAAPSAHRTLTLFGKVYADLQQAYFVEAMMQRLYEEQGGLQAGTPAGHGAAVPFLPRPLGLVAALGLRLDEAVQPADAQAEPVRTGLQVLRPQLRRGRAGGITMVDIPRDELRSAALALARLHTSAVRPTEKPPRTGAQEAKRACKRAKVIAARYPAQAQAALQLAQQLAAHLERVHPDVYRPAHGGFKASQLLLQGPHVVMVDFDGFCLADPALDVAYLLAYLRPSGLWYHRPGLRAWFNRAATEFVSAYRAAMLERGIAHAEIDRILDHVRLYEAAILFKVATRRVHHLNSPRPQELSAMLGEIATCLAAEAWRH
jgi:Phosphotransferase enzyme family